MFLVPELNTKLSFAILLSTLDMLPSLFPVASDVCDMQTDIKYLKSYEIYEKIKYIFLFKKGEFGL